MWQYFQYHKNMATFRWRARPKARGRMFQLATGASLPSFCRLTLLTGEIDVATLACPQYHKNMASFLSGVLCPTSRSLVSLIEAHVQHREKGLVSLIKVSKSFE